MALTQEEFEKETEPKGKTLQEQISELQDALIKMKQDGNNDLNLVLSNIINYNQRAKDDYEAFIKESTTTIKTAKSYQEIILSKLKDVDNLDYKINERIKDTLYSYLNQYSSNVDNAVKLLNEATNTINNQLDFTERAMIERTEAVEQKYIEHAEEAERKLAEQLETVEGKLVEQLRSVEQKFTEQEEAINKQLSEHSTEVDKKLSDHLNLVEQRYNDVLTKISEFSNRLSTLEQKQEGTL
ncbi:hypothetical protein [Bacillus cereus]|uniref:hypothetical protein n=1 Tax=Bacillus cereus TaxID=1396 RepID=UPI0024BC40F9|nr:hypothetical protein [Bacillus cereus]